MFRRLFALTLALGIIGIVVAQDPKSTGTTGDDPKAKLKGKMTPEAMVDSILERMDKNKDGKISRDEVQGRIKDNFDRIDTNKDGFLDRDELLRMARAILANPAGQPKGPGPGGFGPPSPRDEFDALDKNADGRLTREELKGTRYYDLFDQIDKNKDGKIDPKEWEEFHKTEKK
jgi:Ca2+-binding EF-hand superfamily protein